MTEPAFEIDWVPDEIDLIDDGPVGVALEPAEAGEEVRIEIEPPRRRTLQELRQMFNLPVVQPGPADYWYDLEQDRDRIERYVREGHQRRERNATVRAKRRWHENEKMLRALDAAKQPKRSFINRRGRKKDELDKPVVKTPPPSRANGYKPVTQPFGAIQWTQPAWANDHIYNPLGTTINATGGDYLTVNAGWTTATTGTYTHTYTGEITMAATHPQVWRTWRDEQRQFTYVQDGRGHTTVYADEQAALINQGVYDRWHVIAERDRRTFAEIEEIERQRAEAREQVRIERQRYNEEQSRLALARQQRREGADERALDLLKMILSPEERLRWENDGLITVRGSEGGLYEIDTRLRGVHGNIYEIDGHGCHLASMCVAPQMTEVDPELGRIALPLADGWVGQYLTLKHNEPLMRAKANFGGYRACQHPGIPILGEQAA